MADDAERVRQPGSHQNDAPAPSLEAPEPIDPDTQDDETLPPQLSPRKRLSNNRTPESVALAFYALVEDGKSPREAAITVGIHLRTAQRLLARHDADLEAIQAATRVIMASEALDRVDDWRTAARVGANKRGNHLPAKDWLLHAGVIEPLQGENQAGIRVSISIGTEDRPLKVPSPLLDQSEEGDH